MSNKPKDYTLKFRKICENAKVTTEFGIIDSERIIYSLFGVFENELAEEIINCLILNGLDAFKESLNKQILGGNLIPKNAKIEFETEINKYRKVTSKYYLGKDEKQPIWIKSDNKEIVKLKGIDINEFNKYVNEYDFSKYRDSAFISFDVSEIKRQQNNKYKIELSLFSEYELKKLFAKLKAKKFISGEEDVFVRIFTGEGMTGDRLVFSQPTHLYTFIKVLKEKFILPSVTNWGYINKYIISRNSKEDHKFSAKNAKRSANPEMIKVLSEFLA